MFLSLACASAAAANASRPNIVVILVDDMGFSDIGCYGSEIPTPNLDKLAEGGLRFTQFYNTGRCCPTRASLLTGLYPHQAGVGHMTEDSRMPGYRGRLNDRCVTIAEVLRTAGYFTAISGKWHLGEDAEYHPHARGFDEAIVSMGVHFDFDTNPKTDYPKGQYLADFLTDHAVDFIKRHKEEPFFLYLPHFAVHSPHQAKADLIAHFKSKTPTGGHHDPTYAAMISSVDESVGRIMALLDELKIADNTVLIFSSDNGGCGGYDRPDGLIRDNPEKKGGKYQDKEDGESGSITDNAPLRSGKGSLYEGGTRDPFIIRWPGVTKPGATSDVPAIHVDLYPTLLEIAGARPPANYPLDGESLVPLFHDGSASLKRAAIYQHFPGYLGAGPGQWRTTPVTTMISGDWKLMEFLEDKHFELYNLRDDIGETKNLAATMPDRVKEMHAQMLVWRADIQASMPQPNTDPQSASSEGKSKKKKRNKNSAE